MVIVRFETLNPLTPDPDFDNLFCVFLQAIGEFQFLETMIPASYWGIRACKVFFAGKLLGRSHLEGPVVAKPLGNSYARFGCWGIPFWRVLRVSVCLFSESRFCGTI